MFVFIPWGKAGVFSVAAREREREQTNITTATLFQTGNLQKNETQILVKWIRNGSLSMRERKISFPRISSELILFVIDTKILRILLTHTELNFKSFKLCPTPSPRLEK